jgi:hypothetical protein
VAERCHPKKAVPPAVLREMIVALRRRHGIIAADRTVTLLEERIGAFILVRLAFDRNSLDMVFM